jgi:hypothetical protein
MTFMCAVSPRCVERRDHRAHVTHTREQARSATPTATSLCPTVVSRPERINATLANSVDCPPGSRSCEPEVTYHDTTCEYSCSRVGTPPNPDNNRNSENPPPETDLSTGQQGTTGGPETSA